ncbi:MAG: peptidylprolyl isomerase [Pseudomonadota bacterium]
MKHLSLAAAIALAFASPALAQVTESEPAPSPNDIVSAAQKGDWVQIAPDDLLVMTLAPDAEGNGRVVVIQLVPAPFSQGWVENIRTLARAEWYDGISVNRVQDNYVVQWGDPGHDNPEGDGIETKPLPVGLNVMVEGKYFSTQEQVSEAQVPTKLNLPSISRQQSEKEVDFEGLMAALTAIKQELETRSNYIPVDVRNTASERFPNGWHERDAYAEFVEIYEGWPLASAGEDDGAIFWPVHCYGMVGVGRNYSPDTGTGAELYTVIGHAPRHLDRNIALVGRIIEGMEHLSSLPRGSGALGFYTNEEAEKRTPILSIRVASDLPEDQRPQFEYLSTESESFARYAEARANRRDPFFIVPAGGADICNIPVPIREAGKAEEE